MKGSGHGLGPAMVKDLSSSLEQEKARKMMKRLRRIKAHPNKNSAILDRLKKRFPDPRD